MNNDEIINKWVKDSNYSGFMTPIESITMLDEARADERQQLANRMKLIEAQSKSLTKAIQEDIEFIAKLKKETAKEIFEKLDALCSDTGVGLGLDLEDALSNNARDSDKFRQTLHALKKKMRIE